MPRWIDRQTARLQIWIELPRAFHRQATLPQQFPSDNVSSAVVARLETYYVVPFSRFQIKLAWWSSGMIPASGCLLEVPIRSHRVNFLQEVPGSIPGQAR